MVDGKVEQTSVELTLLVFNGDVVPEEEDKYRFGCGPYRPACLQKIFRDSIFFALILCTSSIVKGSVASGTSERAHTYVYTYVYTNVNKYTYTCTFVQLPAVKKYAKYFEDVSNCAVWEETVYIMVMKEIVLVAIGRVV